MPKINLHERTLSNGLRVIVCPDHGAPVITVNVIYHVGSFDERSNKTGLAHLFEHLMFDNTSTGMDKQYDTYCTKAGGSNNAYTTFDHTTYYINLPSHQLDLGLWLEAERMRMFAITDHALETQRSVVIEEIKQNVENQPYQKWQFALDRSAFLPQSSYSWHPYGSPEHVAGVTLEDAHDFYERYYRPGNAILVIAGDVDPVKAFARAEAHFGDIPAAATPVERNVFHTDHRQFGIHTVETDDVPVPAVFVATHLPPMTDLRIYDAELASSFLGFGHSSVLYRDLVAGSRIASHAGAYVDRRAHTSLLILYAYATQPTTSADQLVDALIGSVRKATVTDDVFTKVVNRQRTAIAAELQRVTGVADNVGYHATFYGDASEVNHLLDRYTERTVEGIQQVVNNSGDIDRSVRVDIIPST